MLTLGLALICSSLAGLFFVFTWLTSRVMVNVDTYYSFWAQQAPVPVEGTTYLAKLPVTRAVFPFSCYGDFVIHDTHGGLWIVPRSSITHKYLRRAFAISASGG